MEQYLDGIEAVTVGGESDREARTMDYDWMCKQARLANIDYQAQT